MKLKIIIITLTLLISVVIVAFFIKENQYNNMTIFELVKSGPARKIKTAVNSGIDVNSVDERGHSLLQIALEKPDNTNNILMLLELGADPTYNKKGIPAIVFAGLNQSDLRIFKKFIEKGADVNNMHVGASPLFFAAGYQQKPDVINFLIKNGADANLANKNGQTPLLYAAENNPNPDIAIALIKAGADVNYVTPFGRSILMGAAIFNNHSVLDELIKNGAATLQHDLMQAIYNDMPLGVIDLLASHADNLNYIDEFGNSPISVLAKATTYPNPDILDILLRNGADINFADNKGETALMHAVSRTNLPYALNILELSNEVFFDDVSQVTPKEVLEDINKGIAERKKENIALIKKLINNGADVNAQDKKGSTALMFAAVYGRDTDYLELLRVNGADLFLKNKKGQDANDLFQIYNEAYKRSRKQK